jgi:hypothetical protein
VVNRMDRGIEGKKGDDQGKAEHCRSSPAAHDATEPEADEQEERRQEGTRMASLGKCP